MKFIEGEKDSLRTVEELSELHERNINRLPVTSRQKDNIRRVFDYIEEYPIIDIKKTALNLGLSYNTVSTIVRKLVEEDILKESTNNTRNRVFVYEEYLSILKRDTELL